MKKTHYLLPIIGMTMPLVGIFIRRLINATDGECIAIIVFVLASMAFAFIMFSTEYEDNRGNE